MLKERLPKKINDLFKEFGKVADTLGYDVYLVGGLVRDVLLKRENLDVDIVVEGDGIRFAHAFAENIEVRVRSHRKFGTAVLIFPNGFKVDVASARMEYYESPAAPPIVETSSLKMDLFRRDFTINTLAVKLNESDSGILVDHFGGQKDIKEKVIRVLHNLSFVEDPTRVLRAIRFEQRFGFKIGKTRIDLQCPVVIAAINGDFLQPCHRFCFCRIRCAFRNHLSQNTNLIAGITLVAGRVRGEESGAFSYPIHPVKAQSKR